MDVSRNLRDMVFVASPEGRYFSEEVHRAFRNVLQRKLDEYRNMPQNRNLYGWTAAERADETRGFLESYDTFDPVFIDYTQFAATEIEPHIAESIRGRDAYIFHAFVDGEGRYEPYETQFLLQLMNFTARFADAAKITDVLPNYPWQRQDYKEKGRVPLSAKVMARNIQADIQRLITMDLHSEQQQGFFDIIVDELYGMRLFVDYYNSNGSRNDLVVVAPDSGAVRRARGLAKRLGMGDTDIVIVDKRRDYTEPNEVYVHNLVGGELVRGRRAIIIDDMIDTGETTAKAAQKVKEAGATYVSACATHPIFSPKNGESAEERLYRSPNIDEIIITDSIPPRASYARYKDKLRVLHAAPLFAEAIYEIQTGGSVSVILEESEPNK